MENPIEQKRLAMVERLSKREESRQKKPDDIDSSESTQSFLTEFSQSKHSIESKLRQNPDPTQLQSISNDITSLENLLAQKSYFLPPYEIRNSLSSISKLKQSLNELSSLITPRNKFSFKNKNNKPTPITPTVPEENKDVVVITEKRNEGVGYRDREGEVLVKEFGRNEFGEFTLSGLKACEVRLKGCVGALFLDGLVDCKVYVGPVMGSVFIEGVEGCVFVLASHQIRIHKAKGCDFYIRVRSRPIIEDSNGVRFAPYCLRYGGIERDLDEAKLGEETGNWANVDDFRWLRAVQSPNWSIIPENERVDAVDI